MEQKYTTPYFMIAEGCNLNCTYCYEHKKVPNNMTVEVFDKAMEYMQKNYVISRNIVLFGGEPTLNEEVINHALKTVDPITEIILITNGVHVTDQTLELIKSRGNVSVQVSLDGTFTTMHERIGDNYSLFEKIIHNSRRYADAVKDNGAMAFHSTKTKNTVGNIYENIMFLLSLKITHWINTTTDFNSPWDEQDLFLYETQFMMLADHISKNPIQGQIKTLECTESPTKYQDGSTAGIKNLMDTSVGEIYPCSRFYSSHKETTKMGDIYQEGPVDESFFQALNYNKTKSGQCKINSCIRCYAANLELNQDILAVNESHCGMSKLNLKLGEYHRKLEDKK